MEAFMKPDSQNVRKSDIQFFDRIRERIGKFGSCISITKTRSKTTFSAFGVKGARETETTTATGANCDDG